MLQPQVRPWPKKSNPEVLPVSLCNSDSADTLVPAHLSQSQSLTLYRSFCAMKYAIYALCVSSHQHSQCRQCKDGPSDDLASVAEPMNDPPSSLGTALPSPLPQQKLRTTCPRRLFAWEHFSTRIGRWPFIMPMINFFHVSASVNQRDMEKASDLYNFSESDLVLYFPNAFFFFLTQPTVFYITSVCT